MPSRPDALPGGNGAAAVSQDYAQVTGGGQVRDTAPSLVQPNDPGGYYADARGVEVASASAGVQGGVYASGYGAGYDPNRPTTIALLAPATDSRPAVREIAEGLAAAAQLALDDIGGGSLTLKTYDTKGDPASAAAAAEQAIAEGASMLIGPLFSGSVSAVRPVAEFSGVPVIAFTTDTSVVGRGTYTIGFLTETEIQRILQFAAQRNLRKIAALAPNTPFGQLVYNGMQNIGPSTGVTVARVQPFTPEFEAMDGAAKAFGEFYEANRDLDAVVLASGGQTLQGLAAYLAYYDVLPTEVKYLGLGAWEDPETFREATLRNGWFPGLDPALRAEFERRYKAAYGGTPPSIAPLGYDAVAVAAALLADARASGAAPYTPQTLENPSGFSGVTGLFRFRADGRNERALAVLEVGRRTFTVVDPALTSFEQQVSSIGAPALQ